MPENDNGAGVTPEPEANGQAADPMGEFRTRLADFFTHNPDADGQLVEGVLGIIRPWGDSTLGIRVTDNAQLIEALNNLYLPPRFSAVWHRDSHDLEFIAFRAPADRPFMGRKFTFCFGQREYQCEWSAASSRIVCLSDSVILMAAPTETHHRNLPFLPPLFDGAGDPTSFWIHGVDWDEEQVVELARNLNFYMTYYDALSPAILVHELSGPASGIAIPQHLPSTFPETINGRALDPYLLLLWQQASGHQPAFLKFLYLYQILEYAAFYHLDEQTAAKVKRLLAAPDAMWKIDQTVHELLDAFAQYHATDEQKNGAVIRLTVPPEALWSDFQLDLPYFTAGVNFDGGLHLEPLLDTKWGLEDFTKAVFPSRIADYYRWIRNAIAHARERRQADVMLPTNRNAQLLQPWLRPLRTIAAHAMVYKSA
jgi:hypothetical protein